MNQILFNENNNKQKRKKTAELLDMKKVIIVFSVLIIVFALVILGAKFYGRLKEKEENSSMAKLNKPAIKIEEIEQQCKIRIDYDEGISKISYSWNNGDLEEINMNTTFWEKGISIPDGYENTLYVKAVGADNSENELTEVFYKEEIKLEQTVGTNLITITVIDGKGLDQITYQWENEEEVIIEGNGRKEIKETIEAKRGINTIKIIATDSEGNKLEKQEPMKGVLIPEIETYIQDNILYMSVRHDMGFKKVIFKVNDAELIYDENNPQYEESKQELKTSLPLLPGKTTIQITAYSLEDERSVNEYKDEIEIQ